MNARTSDGLWQFSLDAAGRGPRRSGGSPPSGRRRRHGGAGQLQRRRRRRRRARLLRRRLVPDATVRVPSGWAGQRIVLHFESATHRATVWVGDVEVGSHEGGYTPFEFDITELVAAGEEARDHRRRRQPTELPDHPAGRHRGHPGRPAAAVLPRLLQLLRPAPLGLAVQPPPAAHLTDVTVSPSSTAPTAPSTTRSPTVAADDRRSPSCCATPTGTRSPAGNGASGTLTVADVAPLGARARLPLRPRGPAGRPRRRTRRQLPPERRHPHRPGRRDPVPDQRRAVLLHRLRQARGHRGHRQGPQRRLPAARLRAAELDRRELVPHLPLPLLRGRARPRRPAGDRHHRRDRRPSA